MDWIRDTVRNTVFRRFLSGKVVIGSPEEFSRYANQISQVDSLYLLTAEIPSGPAEDVQYSSSIPDTLKTHRVVCVFRNTKLHTWSFTKWALIQSHIALSGMVQDVDTSRMDKMRVCEISA